MKPRRLKKGFTLIELLVAVAIVALLTAIGIPQFLKFRYKALRTEAYLTLDGAHKAQTAFYSLYDYYYFTCMYPCTPIPQQVAPLNRILGIDNPINVLGRPATAHGYQFWWSFTDPYHDYTLRLVAYLTSTVFTDNLMIAVGGDWMALCQPCGAEEGQPYLMQDGIKYMVYCPC